MAAVRAAGFIIFRRLSPPAAPEYLLLKASYGDRHWTPPKGHVDPGEDDWTTAVRETREEAGLTVEDLNVIKDFKIEMNYTVKASSYRGEHRKVVTYWLAGLVDPKSRDVILSDEHTEFKWLGLDDACVLAKYEDMQDTLRKCDAKLAQVH